MAASMAVLFAAIFVFSACGDAECADGEVLQGDSCVAIAQFCDDGEILRDGQCVDPDVLCDEDTVYDESIDACIPGFEEITCGDNTEQEGNRCVAPEPTNCGGLTEKAQLDANTNECVPTDEVCGEHTAFTEVEGEHRCLPTDEVCDQGTEFSEEVGLCLPEAECRPGDVIIDGYCAPEAAELADDAEFKAQGNTNPEFGGEPVEIDISGEGEMSIFSGTIGEPEDLNDDGQLDQIVDVFEFDAREGDWFEISVRSMGIPNPAFVVTGGDDEVFWERYSSLGAERDTMRQIAIPADGTYTITVLPESLLSDDEHMAGGDDWDYVGSLELLETPEAQEHSFEDEHLQETIGRLDDNFFVFDEFNANNLAEFNWEHQPTHADSVVMIWDEKREFVGEYREDSFRHQVPDDGRFYAIFDWDARFGTVELDYEVSAQELRVLEEDDQISQTISATAGDVLRLTQDNDSDATIQVSITDDDGEVLLDESLSTSGMERYIGLSDGEHTITFTNDTSDTVEGFSGHVDHIEPEALDLDTVYTGTANTADEEPQDYYVVDTDETVDLEVSAQHLDGTGEGRLFLYGPNHTEEGGSSPFSDLSPQLQVTVELEADTTYVFRVGNNSYGDNHTFDYELSFRQLVHLDEGDEITESFSADDNDLVEVSQSNKSQAPLRVVVVDDDSGEQILDETVDNEQTVVQFPLDSGDYTATLTNESNTVVEDVISTVFVSSPVEKKSFDADADETLSVAQLNDEGVTVDVFIVDEDNEIAAYGSLPWMNALPVDVDEGTEYTIWYYRSGKPEDEQVIDDLSFRIDLSASIDEGDSISYDIEAEEGDVLKLWADFDAISVLTRLYDSTGEQIWSTSMNSSQSFMRYHVLAEGNYTVEFNNFTDEDIEQFLATLEVTSPEEITDLDQTIEGVTNQGFDLPQSYYLFELDESATYDVTLTHTGGDGSGRVYLYKVEEIFDLLDSNVSQSNPTESKEIDFEADTTYVLRIGGIGSDQPYTFGYELSFE